LYKAAFKQSGIIEADGFEEMFDMAKAFVMQPIPKGNRVLVLTNAGGFGVMATDALEKLGLEVPETPQTLVEELSRTTKLPPFISLHNPIDLTGSVVDEWYRDVLNVMLKNDFVDAVLLIALFQVPNLTEKLVDYIVEAKKYGKPVIAVQTGSEVTKRISKMLEEHGIPVYLSPERAAKSLWALVEYGKWGRRR